MLMLKQNVPCQFSYTLLPMFYDAEIKKKNKSPIIQEGQI